MLVAAELSVLLEEGEPSRRIAERAGAVMRSVAPLAVKAVVGLAGRVLIGISDVQGEVEAAVKAATDAGADAGKKWLESAVASFEEEKKSVAGFKATLTEAVSGETKPVVVFIDELDRCKPSFAISMLERIKHLFDVPNLVVVLLLHRTQLEMAIKGVYGEGFDGREYLGKFLNVWFDLPQSRNGKISNSNANVGPFVRTTLQKLAGRHIENFDGDMQVWTSLSICLYETLSDVACWRLPLSESTTHTRPHWANWWRSRSSGPTISGVPGPPTRGHCHALSQWLETFCADRNEEPGYWPGRLLLGLSAMHLELAGQQLEGAQLIRWTEDKKLLLARSTTDRAIERLSALIDLPLGE